MSRFGDGAVHTRYRDLLLSFRSSAPLHGGVRGRRIHPLLLIHSRKSNLGPFCGQKSGNVLAGGGAISETSRKCPTTEVAATESFPLVGHSWAAAAAKASSTARVRSRRCLNLLGCRVRKGLTKRTGNGKRGWCFFSNRSSYRIRTKPVSLNGVALSRTIPDRPRTGKNRRPTPGEMKSPNFGLGFHHEDLDRVRPWIRPPIRARFLSQHRVEMVFLFET